MGSEGEIQCKDCGKEVIGMPGDHDLRCSSCYLRAPLEMKDVVQAREFGIRISLVRTQNKVTGEEKITG